jgi:hypothetical protein
MAALSERGHAGVQDKKASRVDGILKKYFADQFTRNSNPWLFHANYVENFSNVCWNAKTY